MEAHPSSLSSLKGTNIVEKEFSTMSTEGGTVRAQKKHFNFWSALGIQYSVTAAPLTLGMYMSLSVGLGGAPFYFWGFIFVGIMQFIGALAVSEIASALPHSSGPAHWVMVLAPPRYAQLLGYMMGWLTNCAWMCVCAASCLYPAQLLAALIQVAHPDVVIEPWHTYLLYLAVALMGLVTNLPKAFHCVEYLMSASVILINGTAIFLFVSLLVLAKPKASAETVFVDVVNESGWSSNGVVFFLSLIPGLAALGGLDNAVHLTDELAEPRKQVPRIIIGSFLMSFFTGVPIIICYQFSNVDPMALLDPVARQPFVQLLLSGYGSIALTVAGITLVLICILAAYSACIISWSRLYWSFSQNGTLPLSSFTSRLSSTDDLPLYSLVWCTVILAAIGAISIGSLTAMNALLGGAVVCSLIAFATVFALALLKGRDNICESRVFDLGIFGPFCYWTMLIWCLFMTVWLCMPLYLPVTLETMNWTSVVVAGFAAISGIWWVLVFSRQKLTTAE
ncbi:hypothetical protein V500_04120 [Pseudogymnoascus sp. VKM F-4518 (FW-2643)]|nr:hypothetical protein V500_04120 [Pseudogymnoascus sp. VKM F-4518 (FW-2643)]